MGEPYHRHLRHMAIQHLPGRLARPRTTLPGLDGTNIRSVETL